MAARAGAEVPRTEPNAQGTSQPGQNVPVYFAPLGVVNEGGGLPKKQSG
jgi:hypothetical protein